MLAARAEQNEQSTCAFEVAGAELVADPAGIAFWPEEKCLIVSDLHLEKGSSFARRGQMLPPYDTGATLAGLQRVMDFWKPEMVIALGDSFHDKDASSRLPPACRRHLSAMASSCDWIWISGNHDPDPPEDLAGLVADELAIGPLVFRHEPTRNGGPGEISGHLHPAAKITVQGRSIRKRCFATSRKRLIMPAFGAFTGGLNVLDKAYDGLFDQRDFYALMLGNDQVFALSARRLKR